ncbi:tetratricopeptide repeat protein [Actinoplanes lobatus]|uniref:Tetratricopeptide (TPR) repeat protein n=1 Tax=Actinoplanes lobatus TaxID=113568 RepID=A0A7W7HN15_9ACTN|nr:tetratricopeptide repeat protein [Actinoplanes lobatus]MBB4753534.1 tetratricopeptide (TPR) repeat protein [Actinoplanes lobatus]
MQVILGDPRHVCAGGSGIEGCLDVGVGLFAAGAVSGCGRGGEATTLNNIGKVYNDLGDRQQALACHQQALPIQREIGDRAGEAAALNNIGKVYNDLGDQQQALTYLQQALLIRREVGDRAGEAAVHYNLARIHRDQGNLDQAINELEIVVDLDRQVSHTGLASDTAMLHRLRQQRATTLKTT